MFTNSTILNPLFWMILGALNVFFFIGLKYFFADRKLKLSTYKWMSVALYWIFLCLLIGAAFTLIGENELKAGLRLLAFFSIPMLLLGVVLKRWIFIKSGMND